MNQHVGNWPGKTVEKKGGDELIKAIVSSASKGTAGHVSIPQVKEEHRAALEERENE